MMHIIDFYRKDFESQLNSNLKPMLIEVLCVENGVECFKYLDSEEFAEWVKEHPEHSGYYERNTNIEPDIDEYEIDEHGFLQGKEKKVKVLDWGLFLLEMDKAVIVEYLKSKEL